MRTAEVYRNGELAGILTQGSREHYIFRYDDTYYSNASLPPISLTLLKNQQEYEANHLFPFFFNMLSEGANRKLQCRQLKIDESDYFGLLLATANCDTIGAITIKPIKTEK